MKRGAVLLFCKLRIVCKKSLGRHGGLFGHGGVGAQGGDLEGEFAALSCGGAGSRREKITRPPHFQILIGNFQSFLSFAQGRKPLPGGTFPVAFGNQDTVGLRISSAHPASQLVQLRQSEAFGVFHNHQGGIGHIDPHLNDGGGDQHLYFVPGKGGHDLLFFLGLHFSVHKAHPQGRHGLLQFFGKLHSGFQGKGLGVFLLRMVA